MVPLVLLLVDTVEMMDTLVDAGSTLALMVRDMQMRRER